MAVDEQDNTSEFTPREAELQRQIDGLQIQVTDLHKAQETTENPELSSEVQSLKEKLGEHSKQLELSTEKLNQLQSENAALRDKNKAPNTASNKKRCFNTRNHDIEESDSEPEPEKEEPEKTAAESSITAYLEQMFSKRFDAMQSMVELLPGVAPPMRRSNPDSYTDTPIP
ncbi:hypothetical protein F2Q70_00016808 [Brassica cretica]|uniref:Uncharacterized protein n=1 Tax=Brassica cretica TaxID=69181 RepID=A0A3N6QAT9_BRACR|nr:hypothetical protein F2Q70_00016808 [Brassica cretica]KAF2599788.1 hypothetical protein F2Q68_00009772 [Brassica cretica]